MLSRPVQLNDYRVPPLVAPNSTPYDQEISGQAFNAKAHLKIELPEAIKDLSFKNVSFPYSSSEKKIKQHLAYTQPFRVLSPEGVRLAKEELYRFKGTCRRSTDRAPQFYRGLGHLSNFHRGLAYSPELISVLNQLSRDELTPHNCTSNISHTNFGMMGTGKPVDKWHLDSVDYVLVIILSDLTDMVGGDLKVVQRDGGKQGQFFQMLQERGVPEDLVETVKYGTKNGGAGYGVLMQGSKILHMVSEVIKEGGDPCISLVMSYGTTRPFTEDRTKYHSHRDVFQDGESTACVEFARHKAWRVAGQMDYIMKNLKYGTDPQEICRLMQNSAEELQKFVLSVQDRHLDVLHHHEDKASEREGEGEEKNDSSPSSSPRSHVFRKVGQPRGQQRRMDTDLRAHEEMKKPRM